MGLVYRPGLLGGWLGDAVHAKIGMGLLQNDQIVILSRKAAKNPIIYR